MSYLVAFHGLPRAGKGTAAQALIDQKNFTRGGFGDAVYIEVATTFGVTVEQLRSHEWKTEPQTLLRSCRSDCSTYKAVLESLGENLKAAQTSRYHLRRWATEYKRKTIDNLYWVKELHMKLEYERGNILVDDLRFVDSEYPYLRHLAEQTGRTLKVLEIVRPSYNHDASHVSDTHLPFHLIDEVFENREGLPEVLQGDVLNYLYPSGE